jgi:TM2 domain-containing membrane protein YozV
LYNGQVGKAILLFAVQIVNFFLVFLLIGFLTLPAVWIFGIYDAYTQAQKINQQPAGY